MDEKSPGSRKPADMRERRSAQRMMVERLYASTVNGLPFLDCMGVRAYVLDEDAVCLYGIPRNPNRVTGIRILCCCGADTYDVHVFTGSLMASPAKLHINVYFDELAELVASEMGVI